MGTRGTTTIARLAASNGMLALLVGAGYAAGAEAAWSWFGAGGSASLFPAAGVLFGALVVLPRSRWPFALLGAGLAELVVDLAHGLPVAAAFGYVAANLVQGVVGAAFVRRASSLDIARPRALAAFVAFGVVAAPAVGAALGATTFVVLDSGSGPARFALEWWVGDGLGVLIVGSALLSLGVAGRREASVLRLAEGAGYVLVSGGATALAFGSEWWPALFVPVGLLLVAGFRTQVVGVAVAGAVIALVAADVTARGGVGWDRVGVDARTGFLYVQASLGLVVLGALSVASALREREVALAERLVALSERHVSAAAAALAIADRAFAERLATAVGPAQVGEVFLREAIARTDAAAGAVMLLDRSERNLRPLVELGETGAGCGGLVDASSSDHLIAVALDRGDVIEVVGAEVLASGFPTLRSASIDAQSAVGMPLRAAGRMIGGFHLLFVDGRQRTLDDLARLAQLCGEALSRAEAHEHERRSRWHAELLEAHAGAVARAADVEEVCAALLETMRALTPEGGIVTIFDGSTEKTTFSSSRRIDLRTVAATRVEGVPATTDGAAAWEDGLVDLAASRARDAYGDALREAGAAWAFRVVMQGSGGTVIGVVAVGAAEATDLDAGARRVVRSAASQVEAALERVWERERRERAEAELRDRHRFVSELTSLVPGALYVIDLAADAVVFANDEAARLAIGDLESRLLHPDDRLRLAERRRMFGTLANGSTLDAQFRVAEGDGQWRIYESRDAVLSRDDDGQVREVIGVAVDVTERARQAELLRVGVARQRFRAALADGLRLADDPYEACAAAARLLGEHLGVARVYCVELTSAGDAASVREEFCAPQSRSIRGSLPEAYGAHALAAARAGRTVRVVDVCSDERLTPIERAAAATLDMAAYVLAPMRRDASADALVALHDVVPRVWSDDEVALVEETVERLGETVERTRAAARLREREERYSSLFTSIDEGYCLCEMIVDDDGRATDYRFLEANPQFEEQTGLRDAVGRTALELVPTLERRWIETYTRVGIGGETLRFEEGSDVMGRWFEVFAAPVPPAGSRRFCIVFNDVSERRAAASAIEDAQERERRAQARRDVVAATMGALEGLGDPATLADRLVAALVPRIADFATLEAPDRSEPVLALAHRHPRLLNVLSELRQEHRIAPDAAHSVGRASAGEEQLIPILTPALIEEYATDRATRLLLDALHPHSHIAVPLDLGEERGALLLGLSEPGRRPYGAEELELAREIASRAGLLFASARVREEERQIGARLQDTLLPAGLLKHPAVQLAARYETGSDVLRVGGDWYDSLQLDDGRIVLAVGDVVGHGLDAAAAMGRLRIAFATLAATASSAGDLLVQLDRFASGANGAPFATVACVVIDPTSGRFEHASAGHPPILRLGADGSSSWVGDRPAPPLGSGLLGALRPSIGTLGPGDLLILFSDGLVERRDHPLDSGLRRLEAQARALVAAPAETICRELIEAAAADSPTVDDTVVLVLRFCPVTATRFRRILPAAPSELTHTRAALRMWLASRGQQALERRLLPAIGEALANAVEHAYLGRGGLIDLQIDDDDVDGLRVAVRDHGRWRVHDGTERRDDRGNGMRVMRELGGPLTVERRDDGTTVQFALSADA